MHQKSVNSSRENGKDPFSLGKGSQQTWLYILFCAAAFVLFITFLNMLIAIMGNTFSMRNELANEIMVKDHLDFVMDNWHLIDLAFKDKQAIKYIITAFVAEDEDDHVEMLQNLQ